MPRRVSRIGLTVADKIGRHYSGTWSGTINRDVKAGSHPQDFIHQDDHPNSTANSMTAEITRTTKVAPNKQK